MADHKKANNNNATTTNGNNVNGNAANTKSDKKKKTKKKNDAQQEAPQEDSYQTDPNGTPYGETEMALLRLHSNLIDFYSKHNPENVNEEVLTILMQFFIDAGGVALNKKLMAKYGEDLQTFKRLEEPPPPPFDLDNTLRRTSQRKSLHDDLGIDLPPPPKVETTITKDTNRASLESKLSQPVVFDHKPNKKKAIDDPDLKKFKAEKVMEVEASSFAVDEILLEKAPSEDSTRKLFILDNPKAAPLSSRDLIEAFYAKYDESKLDSDKGIEKFVLWVEEHSLQELSDKLKGKYGEGLVDPSMEKIARRRRNLEDLLTAFYLKHDRPKLETRWTILKILNWTLENGVPALNKKFITRYGYAVVNIPSEADLDI